jgi:hypothetical protein
VINQTLPALAAVVPGAVPVPLAFILFAADVTKIKGVVLGAAGKY